MRVVAYIRVSSASQIDAWGLDRQKAAIRQYVKLHEHKLIAWESDEGVSGTIEAVDRKGLASALSRISKRQADALVIADLDRFARKLTVQETALALVWKAGGRVFTAVSGEVHEDDPEDPSRTLIRQVMGAVIEFEKRQAVSRMRGGIKAKAAAGKHATGAYPFGYRGEGVGRERDAAPHPVQQDALRLILRMRGEGASYRTICAALDDAGHKTKHAGGPWLPMTVKRIYDREVLRTPTQVVGP